MPLPLSRHARAVQRWHGGSRGQQGQSTIEFVGMVPFVLIALVLAFQAYVTVVATERVNNAVRTAARVASVGGDGRQAALAALPGWLEREGARRYPAVEVEVAGGAVHATVSAKVPIVFGVPYDYVITRDVQMPVG